MIAFEPYSVVILFSEAKYVAGYENLYATYREPVPLCL